MTNEPSSANLRPAEELLERGDVQGAIEALKALARTSDAPEIQALLGLALFRNGEYASAASAYELALARDPGNSYWTEMLGKARANDVAEIQVFVPEVRYPVAEDLLAPATSIPDVLPSPLPPAKPGLVRKALKVVGDGLGFVVSFFVDAITQVVGRIKGYKDDVWTNWYRKRLTLGILTLGYMRTRLNRDNLRNTYPKKVLIGFQEPGQTPPVGATQFRTADGSWNNLEDPKEGAAGTRFPRNVRNRVARAETGERLLTPNPRLVSRMLLTRDARDEGGAVPEHARRVMDQLSES